MAWQLTAVSLLVSHLLCIQLASAGPMVAVLLERESRRARKDSDRIHQIAQRLARDSFWALLLGVALGLILAWLAVAVGQRDYAAVLQRFYSRVWWGGWELVFSAVVLMLYWWGFHRRPARTLGRAIHRLLAVISATNLLYHFPPLLTVMVEYLQQPSELLGEVSSAEFRALIFAPAVIATTVHFAFASVAVAAGWLMWRAGFADKVGNSADSEEPASVIQLAAWVAVAALVLQMLTGIWLVAQIAPANRGRLMGSDPVASGLLMCGILGSLVALNQNANLAMGDYDRKQLRMAAGSIALVVLLMVATSARLSGLM